MKKKNPLEEEPHIVKVIYNKDGVRIGAIADNYCVKTVEEVNARLDRCGRIYGDSLSRKAEREALENGPVISDVGTETA